MEDQEITDKLPSVEAERRETSESTAEDSIASTETSAAEQQPVSKTTDKPVFGANKVSPIKKPLNARPLGGPTTASSTRRPLSTANAKGPTAPAARPTPLVRPRPAVDANKQPVKATTARPPSASSNSTQTTVKPRVASTITNGVNKTVSSPARPAATSRTSSLAKPAVPARATSLANKSTFTRPGAVAKVKADDTETAQQLKDTQDIVRAKEQKIADLEASLASADQFLAMSQDEVHNLQKQAEETLTTLTTTQAELSEAIASQGQQALLDKQLSQAQDDLVEARQSLTNMQSELASMRTKHADSLASMIEKHGADKVAAGAAANGRVADLERQLAAREADLAAAAEKQANIGTLHSRIAAHEQELDSLRTSKAQMQQQLAEYHQSQSKNDTIQQDQLSQQLAAQKEEHAQFVADLEAKHRAESESLQKRFTDVKSESKKAFEQALEAQQTATSKHSEQLQQLQVEYKATYDDLLEGSKAKHATALEKSVKQAKADFDEQLAKHSKESDAQSAKIAAALEGLRQARLDADNRLQSAKDGHAAELESLRLSHAQASDNSRSEALDALKQSHLQDLQQLKEQSAASLAQLQQAHKAEMEAERQNLSMQLKSLQAESSAQLSALKTDNLSLSASLADANKTSKTLQKTLGETHDLLAKAQIGAVDSQSAAVSSSNDKQMDELQAMLASSWEETTAMREAVEKAQAELAKQHATNAGHEETIQKLETTHRKAQTSLRAEVDSLQSRLNAMRVASPTHSRTSSTSADRDREITSLHHAHNAKVDELTKIVVSLTEENANLKDMLRAQP